MLGLKVLERQPILAHEDNVARPHGVEIALHLRQGDDLDEIAADRESEHLPADLGGEELVHNVVATRERADTSRDQQLLPGVQRLDVVGEDVVRGAKPLRLDLRGLGELDARDEGDGWIRDEGPHERRDEGLLGERAAIRVDELALCPLQPRGFEAHRGLERLQLLRREPEVIDTVARVVERLLEDVGLLLDVVCCQRGLAGDLL